VQVVADRRALPGRFKDHGDEIARGDSRPARNVLYDRVGRPDHTRFSGATRDILYSYKEEPLYVYIAYGGSACHCLRHVFELGDAAACH